LEEYTSLSSDNQQKDVNKNKTQARKHRQVVAILPCKQCESLSISRNLFPL